MDEAEIAITLMSLSDASAAGDEKSIIMHAAYLTTLHEDIYQSIGT